jgi:hypothetical protein
MPTDSTKPSNLPNLRRLFVEARTDAEESEYSRNAVCHSFYLVITNADRTVLQSCDFHVVNRWLQSHRSAYDDWQDRYSVNYNAQAYYLYLLRQVNFDSQHAPRVIDLPSSTLMEHTTLVNAPYRNCKVRATSLCVFPSHYSSQ